MEDRDACWAIAVSRTTESAIFCESLLKDVPERIRRQVKLTDR